MQHPFPAKPCRTGQDATLKHVKPTSCRTALLAKRFHLGDLLRGGCGEARSGRLDDKNRLGSSLCIFTYFDPKCFSCLVGKTNICMVFGEVLESVYTTSLSRPLDVLTVASVVYLLLQS